MGIGTLHAGLFDRLGGKVARTVVRGILPGCQRTFASDDGTNVYNHFRKCQMIIIDIH